MPVFLSTSAPDFEAKFRALLSAKREDSPDVDDTVARIIADVRCRGDRAVVELTERFDRLTLDWVTAAGHLPITTEFTAYTGAEMLAFDLSLPAGANLTALGTAISVMDEVVAAFPRFSANHTASRLQRLGVFAPRGFWDLDMLGVGLDGLVGGVYGGAPLTLARSRLAESLIEPSWPAYGTSVKAIIEAASRHASLLGRTFRAAGLEGQVPYGPRHGGACHGRLKKLRTQLEVKKRGR